MELFTNPGEVLLFVPLPAATDQSSQIALMPTAEPIPTASLPVMLGVPQTLGRGQHVVRLRLGELQEIGLETAVFHL